jgi:hypothetical protein
VSSGTAGILWQLITGSETPNCCTSGIGLPEAEVRCRACGAGERAFRRTVPSEKLPVRVQPEFSVWTVVENTSMRNVAALYGEEWLWHSYGNMIHSVATGPAELPAVKSTGSVFDDAAAIVSCYPFVAQ